MKRHPQAIAWDEFTQSPEGKLCFNGEGIVREGQQHYLVNRLMRAFTAGWDAAMECQRDKLIEEKP